MGNILVPFKKFLSNKNTITILGVLLGVVVLYLGYNWRVNRSIQPTNIPYATETLIAGTKITEASIGYTKVPKDTIKNMTNILSSPQDINGKLVSFDSKIPVNGFFFKENIIAESEMPDSVFSNIPDGHTIYALKVDFESTMANSMMPGDKIDIYMSTQSQEQNAEGKLVYGRLIKSITILAVKDKEGQNVFDDKDNLGEPAFMLFSVPEDLFLLLKKAEKLSIELEPIGRNDSYTITGAAVELTSADLEYQILSQTYTIPDECPDITAC